MVAGAALDAAALTLLGLFLAHAPDAPQDGRGLPALPGVLLNPVTFSAPDLDGFPAPLAGAAFVYLMMRIVLGLLTGAVSLLGAGGRFRS